MTLKQKFAREVHQARCSRNLTQFQVAEMVSVTPRSIQYIEKGEWLPKRETMLRLMIVLRISADLFSEEVGVGVPVYFEEGDPVHK